MQGIEPIHECPSSPGSTFSKAVSPKIVRKPQYENYKRLIENRQKKTQNTDTFVGFYSPRRNIQNSKSFLSSTDLKKTMMSPKTNNENIDFSNSTVPSEIQSPRGQVTRFIIAELPKQQDLKLSNKQNSRQPPNRKQSINARTDILIQNSNLKSQIQKLRNENNLLHSQIQSSHYQIQKLKQNQKQNQQLKKSLFIIQEQLKQKQEMVFCLQDTICQLNNKIEQLSLNCKYPQSSNIQHLEEINYQNMITIKKLTDTNKNLEIQLYLLKNKQHQFVVNNAKLKQVQSLTSKNKELRALNTKLKQRIDSITRFNVLEYSPDTTDRQQ